MPTFLQLNLIKITVKTVVKFKHDTIDYRLFQTICTTSEMSSTEFNTCKGLTILTCAPLTVLKPSLPSCPRAIMFNQHTRIVKWCRPQLIIHPTGIIRAKLLRNSQVLIQGSSSDWHLSCSDSMLQKIDKCHFCVISIPCGCLIFSEEFYIDSLGSRCQSHQDVMYS